ncbi:uncharacterized protein LOC113326209 [Papaver somniferum]|uniref:uncharacterized protein LOC113326209 n=1 Tax=Papaver somniferum TaxID=3469 RepID=UPI000E7003ED|nr:uncharacterized protein LOC113326209 [Papaver somniferum]
MNIITQFLLYFIVFIPCGSSLSCKDFKDIPCPFFIHGKSNNCGDPSWELLCENDRTIVTVFSKRFYVLDIDSKANRIQLIDPGLEKDNCSSMPQHSLPASPSYFGGYSDSISTWSRPVVYMNCSKNLSNYTRYLSTLPCVNNTSLNMLTYAIVDPVVSEFGNSCTNFLTSWIFGDDALHNPENSTFGSYSELHKQMMKGFWISYAYDTQPCKLLFEE